jgi:hypothetical protein
MGSSAMERGVCFIAWSGKLKPLHTLPERCTPAGQQPVI